MAHVLTEMKIVAKSECSEAAEIARELGLDLQAKRYEKPLAEHAFQPMSDDEFAIWASHCPTAYFTPPVAAGNRSLASYSFDSIPVEVLKHWKAIKDAYSFDSYQIWTTERTVNSDPLLIGVIGARLYLLARWGLESPGDMPLKELAQSIYDQHYETACNSSVDYPFQRMEKKLSNELARYRKLGGLAVYPEYRAFAAAERILGKL